jgi:hypothetical protein
MAVIPHRGGPSVRRRPLSSRKIAEASLRTNCGQTIKGLTTEIDDQAPDLCFL